MTKIALGKLRLLFPCTQSHRLLMLMNDVVDDVILLQEIYFIFLFLRYTHECGVRWWMMD